MPGRRLPVGHRLSRVLAVAMALGASLGVGAHDLGDKERIESYEKLHWELEARVWELEVVQLWLVNRAHFGEDSAGLGEIREMMEEEAREKWERMRREEGGSE